MKFKALLAGLLTTVALPAFAGQGADILAGVDAGAQKIASQVIRFEVLNQKAGTSSPQSIEFVTKVKGTKTFTEFLAPGDLKGTRALTLSPTQMWVYLPEFGKVRRVASHMTEQGFMGTTLTQQDMGVPQYASQYDAAIESETDTEWTVLLTAKAGQELTFPRIRMVVRKDQYLPMRMEYMGSTSDEVLRTEERGEYNCDASQCMFSYLRMTDHRRGDAWTEIRPVEVQLNVDIPDEQFTPRALQIAL